MFHPQLAHMVATQRTRDIERRSHRIRFDRQAKRRGSIRRAIGHRFIQIGVAIAADNRLRQPS